MTSSKRRREPRISGSDSSRQRLSGKVLTANERKKLTAQQVLEMKQHEDDEEARAYSAGGYTEDRDTGQDVWVDENEDMDVDHVGRVLDGTMGLNISHEGGELFEAVCEAMKGPQARRRRRDDRTRLDETERRNSAFALQLQQCTDSYLEWAASLGDSGLANMDPPPSSRTIQDLYPIHVVDTFASGHQQIPLLQGHTSIPASLIRCGLIPCAPFNPTVAITVRVLDLFRTLNLRSPHLAIQPFVKSICDIQGTPFRSYLSKQFSICLDLYLSILAEVNLRVERSLGRDSNYRLKHACPCCTYKLEEESHLKYSMLFTMDGNDSLKRVLRRKEGGNGESDGSGFGVPNERLDEREVGGGYYLPREKVNVWSREAIKDWLEDPANAESLAIGEEYTPCEDRWKNMASELTDKMWRMFDETGIFLALCRHGFVLVVLDMVQSSELSKYPLAVVKALLDAFGPGLGGGYDIGCQFATTIAKSPLGEEARRLKYKSLVGSFHGHAHNRLCQLNLLATYVEGIGLEDLETCERFFSRSNALASSIRHASVFHRKQRISGFMAHMDRYETYSNLSTFLVNNYKQALQILATEGAFLSQMKDQGIHDENVFSLWLKEERTYLENLKREPQEETVKMEYWQALVNYHASLTNQTRILSETFSILTPESISTARDMTQKKETARRHAQEVSRRDLLHVQELEKRLGVVTRWKLGSEEWKEAEKLVSQRRYQRALDSLEGLVVSRMFELSKMNMSGTGYKLRKHIGNALKSRSQTIRTALEKYNAAAAALKPPKAHLDWDNVVEYAFLADFDLLAETRSDIRDRPWARPAARALLDQYFKIKRAREEIQRLNVEIRRLVTYIQDEEATLLAKEVELLSGDIDERGPTVAYEIRRRRLVFEQQNDIHIDRLQRLALVPGFTGSISPGVSIETGSAGQSKTIRPPGPPSVPGEEEEEEAGEEELRMVDDVCNALEALVCI